MVLTSSEPPLESYPPLEIRRITRREYDAMVMAGFFEDERVELLEGVITKTTPQGGPHSRVIMRLTMLLAPALVGRADLGVQLPFAASELSEPEPDLFIVPRDDEDSGHPSVAYCIIEVAVTSQRRDRYKTRIYAEARVPQLILIDVARREAKVFRDPREGEYDRIETLREGETVVIDAFPEVAFDLAGILPRAGVDSR